MPDMILELKLLSDATFGRGDGIAGEVDAEVQHDDFGFPYLAGRTLKGLLVQECADILAAIPAEKQEPWEKAAAYLFGQPGSGVKDGGHLIIGDAQLPEDLRNRVAAEVTTGALSRQDVLESLTALRRQTAMDETGVPLAHSLRSMRVIVRGTSFRSELFFDDAPANDELVKNATHLLAGCAAALRRAGTGRNRGRGLIKTQLLNSEEHPVEIGDFFKEVSA